MLRCKNCHTKLSRLDKDICPFCGTKKPLEGQEDATQDITKALSAIKIEEIEQKTKSAKTVFVLTLMLGVFGGHLFFLKRVRYALLTLLISLLFIGGFGCLLFFVADLKNALAFLIPYFVLELVMIIYGLIVYKRKKGKDFTGEFLD